MDADITSRVAQGAALLDRTVPGWEDRIDLTRLDQAKWTSCTLGQLGAAPGSFENTLVALGLIPTSTLCDYGFYAYGRVQERANEEYAALTDAWRDLIQQRRLARYGEVKRGPICTAPMDTDRLRQSVFTRIAVGV